MNASASGAPRSQTPHLCSPPVHGSGRCCSTKMPSAQQWASSTCQCRACMPLHSGFSTKAAACVATTGSCLFFVWTPLPRNISAEHMPCLTPTNGQGARLLAIHISPNLWRMFFLNKCCCSSCKRRRSWGSLAMLWGLQGGAEGSWGSQGEPMKVPRAEGPPVPPHVHLIYPSSMLG